MLKAPTSSSRAKFFENFPKTRPTLSPEYVKILRKVRLENRAAKSLATGLSKKMESWMHRKVADTAAVTAPEVKTLEIGAGTLNHLSFEPASSPYDVVEPDHEHFAVGSDRSRVRNHYSSLEEIPVDERYNRIVSVAVLEHVLDLPHLVARSALLLERNGVFVAAIPSEGTPLWYLGMNLVTGIEFCIKYKLSYATLMRHEHVNTASEIETVLRYCFKEVRVKVLGLCRSLSLYQCHVCKAPEIERCRQLLIPSQPE